MEHADWSQPPAGVTPCLRWLVHNLRREGDFQQALAQCDALLPELREDLERLHQELVAMGAGPADQEPVEQRFAAANECYLRAVDHLDAWLDEPTEEALAEAERLVERGAALLEQADALNFSIADGNRMDGTG